MDADELAATFNPLVADAMPPKIDEVIISSISEDTFLGAVIDAATKVWVSVDDPSGIDTVYVEVTDRNSGMNAVWDEGEQGYWAYISISPIYDYYIDYTVKVTCTDNNENEISSQQLVEGTFSGFVSYLTEFWDLLEEGVDEAIEAIDEFVDNIVSKLLDKVEEALSAVYLLDMQRISQELMDLFSTVLNETLEQVDENASMFSNLLHIKKFMTEMTALYQPISDILSLAQQIITPFRTVLDDYSTKIMKMMAKPMLMLGTSLLGAPGAYSEFQTMMDEIIDNQMDLFWDFLEQAGIDEFPTTIAGMIEMAVKMAEAMQQTDENTPNIQSALPDIHVQNNGVFTSFDYTTEVVSIPAGGEVVYDFDVEIDGYYEVLLGIANIGQDYEIFTLSSGNQVYDKYATIEECSNPDSGYTVLRLKFNDMYLHADWNDGSGSVGNRELNGINHIKLKSDNAIVLDWIMVRKTSEGEEHAKSLDASDFIRIDSTVGDGDVQDMQVNGATIPSGEQDFDGDGISNLYELEAMSKGSRFYDPFVSNYRYAILFAQGIGNDGLWDRFGWNDCVDWANMLCSSPDDAFRPGYGWNPEDIYLLFEQGRDPNDLSLPMNHSAGWWKNLKHNVNLMPGTPSDFEEIINVTMVKTTNHTQVHVIISGHGSPSFALGCVDTQNNLVGYSFEGINENISRLNPVSGYEYEIDTLCIIQACYYGSYWVQNLSHLLYRNVVISPVTENVTSPNYWFHTSVLIQQLIDYLHDREWGVFLHNLWHGLLISCIGGIVLALFISFYAFLAVVILDVVIGIVDVIHFLLTYSTELKSLQGSVNYVKIDMEWGFLLWINSWPGNARKPSFLSNGLSPEYIL